MESRIIALFLILILAAVTTGIPLQAALLAGLCLFVFYAFKKGYGFPDILKMILKGIGKAKIILLNFILIGIMTALWRSSGTIASLIVYTSGILRPGILPAALFLLNSLVSFLTGTAFGTAATIGLISSSIALASGISPVITGGAVLSGCFFGDRCSPVSSGMLLVTNLTGVDPYENIRNLLRSSAFPYLLSFLVFAAAGAAAGSVETKNGAEALFRSEFTILPADMIPAATILICSCFRLGIRKTLFAGILLSFMTGILIQERSAGELIQQAVSGFQAGGEEIGTLINGGGIISMGRVASIVCISSAYTGIFEETGLLDGIQRAVETLSVRTNAYTATLVTSVLVCMAACNQTLSVILTDQLCSRLEKNSARFAVWLGDAPTLVAPLIPWSIAGTTVLDLCGLPVRSLLAACFLYLVPLCGLIRSYCGKDHAQLPTAGASTGHQRRRC